MMAAGTPPDDRFSQQTNKFSALAVKFAPQDVQIFEAQIKDDLFGLGFDPLAHTPEFAGLLQSSSLRWESVHYQILKHPDDITMPSGHPFKRSER